MENEAFENNEFDTSLDRQTSEVDLEVGGVTSDTNGEGDIEGILSNDNRGELPLLPYRNWCLEYIFNSCVAFWHFFCQEAAFDRYRHV